MKFISRADQTDTTNSLKLFNLGETISDALFDTENLPRPTKALRWLSETEVHAGLKITDKLKNSNQFLGNQTVVARDEVRMITWVITIETDGLYLTRVEGSKIESRQQITNQNVDRATLIITKHTGIPLVAYIVKSGGKKQLYINSKRIKCSEEPDFPSLEIEQPPIGFPGISPPAIGFLGYKILRSGRIVVRQFDPVALTIGDEITLPFESVLGGVSLALSKEILYLQAEVLNNGKIFPTIVKSSDLCKTFSNPTSIDLSNVPHERVVPGRSRLFIDSTGAIHATSIVQYGAESTILDTHLEDNRIVAAISAENVSHAIIERFPKMPRETLELRFGYGDGITDGAGIIATILTSGKLLASNSQSGGYAYPKPNLLNADMQKMYLYAQTECYTRERPNYVSMDYAFIEADEFGEPISSDLWIETWDMPLPIPQVTASWSGDILNVKITKDGWFFPGQTNFEIDPPVVEITKATFVGYREMNIEFNEPSRARKAKISFETKNVFFYFKAEFLV